MYGEAWGVDCLKFSQIDQNYLFTYWVLGTDGLSEIVTELEMYHQKLYEWTYFIEE